MFFFILEETLSHGLFKLLPLIFTILLSVLFIVSGLFGLLELNKSYISNEWAITSPPKPHSFVSSPLQSSLNKDCLSVYIELLNLSSEFDTIASRLRYYMDKCDAIFCFDLIESGNTISKVTFDLRKPGPDSVEVLDLLLSNFKAFFFTQAEMKERMDYMNSNTELVKDPHLKAKYFELSNSYHIALSALEKFLVSRAVKD